jgi:Tol biopolymer transport system component
MRRSIVAITMLMLLSGRMLTAQSALDLFQQGLELERAKGDLAGAMQIYQRIVREFAADKPVAANALFRLAYCQERIGQAQARKSYEQLLRDYSDQTAVADEARTRLAALTPAENAPRNPAIFIAEMDPRTGTIRGPTVRLTQESGVADRYPTWSPDKKSIAFKRTLTRGGQSSTSIVVRRLDTRVETTGAQEDAGPSYWLPDGIGLASKRGNVINRDNPDGTSQALMSLGLTARDVALAPDGKYLYALVLMRTPVFVSSTVLIFEVATGHRKHAIALGAGSAADDEIRATGSYMSVSPDGSMLAIARWAGVGQPRIAKWGADGTGYGESPVGPGLVQSVTWGKDNRTIFFARSDNGTKWQILLLAPDGSAPKFTGLEVTNLTYFDLSPDGSRIAFDGTDYTVRPQDVPRSSR